jgi:cyclophilin family peptidyl-prolyl cis-trans isomerase
MMRISAIYLLLAIFTYCARAGTLATFKTTVGTMQLELFDEDKPVTVSNFIKYVTSGKFEKQFIQRWEPNFVIQGGGYTVGTDTNGRPDFRAVSTFGTITNEYSVGQKFSNTYGTIAMARQAGKTNSASSQWFLNLTNNAFLDGVDGGFTVFGRLLSGTNVLNLFTTPPTNFTRVALSGYYNDYGEPIVLDTLPALKGPVTDFYQLFTNIIYVNIDLRRYVALHAVPTVRGERAISWTSVAGITNVVEFSEVNSPLDWTNLASRLGTGSLMSVIDPERAADRIYRIKLLY